MVALHKTAAFWPFNEFEEFFEREESSSDEDSREQTVPNNVNCNSTYSGPKSCDQVVPMPGIDLNRVRTKLVHSF